MEYFKHDYVVPDEFSSEAKVLCMRCGIIIMDYDYLMLPKHQEPKKFVPVLSHKPLSHYRLVPVLRQVFDENGQILKTSVTHLPVCKDCQNFEFTDEIGDLIKHQIINAQIAQLKWSGYPQEAVDAVIEKWGKRKLVRRLQGRELESIYLKEAPDARNR
jgi:hypothetical protein